MKITIINILLLSFFVFFSNCTEKQNADALISKPSSALKLNKSDTLLENFKKSMAQLGETAISDTQNHRRILYFGNWIYANERLISVRDVSYDKDLAFFSYAKYHTNAVGYNSDTSNNIKPPYFFIQDLRKVCYSISRTRTERIFNIFDSLAKQNKIYPFGNAKMVDKKGMIIDGGNWVFYFDGKEFYEYNDSDNEGVNLNPLWDSLFSELNIQSINETFNERIP